MPTDDPSKSAKSAVVHEVLKAARDDPQVKEAASNLGQAAVTISQTINTVLLPLAAVNFAFEKARAYFSGGQFERDLAEKAAGIPPEHVVEPKASIAGPTLQGLAFTHEEPNLKEMYLSLLATAMDDRVTSGAHPAFVEIIKQMSAEEADLVRELLLLDTSVPIVQFHLRIEGETGYRVLATHVLNLRNKNTGEPIENPRLPAMVDNWVRLGLAEVDYIRRLAQEEEYAWIEDRPELARLRAWHQDDKRKITWQKGSMERTQFGREFARAVGLVPDGGQGAEKDGR